MTRPSLEAALVDAAARASAEIASWVAAHFTSTAIGTTTVYGLTAPNS